MKVDILAIGVHPDDVELGCSGTILKHISHGKSVAICDLTRGELGSRGTMDTRFEEAANASKILKVNDRWNLKLEDGFFQNDKASLLKLVEVIRFYKPEVVLANAVSDRHPDHGRAGKFISDACFYSGLLKIETTKNGEVQDKHRPKAVYHYIQDRYIKPDLIVDVTKHWDEKLASILAYKTQFYNESEEGPQTPISGKEFLAFIEGRARDFGRTIGAEYGEGFTVERPIGVNDLLTIN